MRGLFITATDTGVGKTEVACALLRGHRARGLDLVAMKPAQSGLAEGELSDAERLRAAGAMDPEDLVCPYRFAPPLAPGVAARLAGTVVSLERILESARRLSSLHSALLVEGAGGLLTPLSESATCAELAVALQLPVLVVARTGLGTVNHTALTCEALRTRHLLVHGIVLNRPSGGTDPSEPYNAAEIERLTGASVLSSLPFVPDINLRERLFAQELAQKVQF